MKDFDNKDIEISSDKQVIIDEKIHALECIKIKKRDPTFHSKGHATEYEELRFIERFNASDGRQVEVYRKTDRANDRYIEIVKDAVTGEIITKTDELLSEHRGHGTAKK